MWEIAFLPLKDFIVQWERRIINRSIKIYKNVIKCYNNRVLKWRVVIGHLIRVVG